MPSATELLKQDHREVEKLFGRFKDSQDDAVATQICDELDVHTEIEEELVYPVLRSDVTNGASLADEAEHEHAEAKQLIGRIKRTTDQDHLVELMTELEQAIQHHVSEEEDEVFPKIDQELGPDRTAELGDQLEARKRSSKRRSPPFVAPVRGRGPTRRRARRPGRVQPGRIEDARAAVVPHARARWQKTASRHSRRRLGARWPTRHGVDAPSMVRGAPRGQCPADPAPRASARSEVRRTRRNRRARQPPTRASPVPDHPPDDRLARSPRVASRG